MTRATFMQQLKALLKRNLLLKSRNRWQTIQEFLTPIYFILILALIRIFTVSKPQPAIPTTTAYNLSDSRFNIDTSKVLYVSPNTAQMADVASRLASQLGLTSGTPYTLFNSPEDAETNYKASRSSVLAGIDFSGSGPQSMTYTIRLPAESIASSTSDYTGQGQCRKDNGLENSASGCQANTYLFTPFTHIQVALDTILIQMSASSNMNITTPSYAVQMLPKPRYESDSTVFRYLSAIYFVLAYSPFISFLTVNLVTEKEKKIKEAMRMMGMRDSAFWLSWGLIYSIIILAVTCVVMLLTWALQLLQNSNFFIFFLLLTLYGISMINLAFSLTPFFSRAETGGALASLATIIISLLYFAVALTRDPATGASKIPVWGLFLLCLLSPVCLSLGIDKAITLDVFGGGMNFETITQGSFPLSYVLIMLAVDVVLYGFLAFYLDSVIPNEYGMRRSPWFCFMPSFWSPKKGVSSDEARLMEAGPDSAHGQGTLTENTGNMEAVSPELRHKNMLRIYDMHKKFKTEEKEIHAVRGISMDIYEGQITALLGHNGAGKTTLIHMLTGMSPATSGSATVYGLDVSDHNELTELRSMIGLCPQHNILFDDLTPREHLEFFGNIKGVEKDSLEAEVTDSLRLVDLTDQGFTMSKELSGGQKRKLCVAIALIGDPKVVFLDEPTAGMDPSSRRHLWRLLKEKRQGKLIVLTTHFMDEADILADRKAVISKGKLQCVGSSLFLKNRFGIGYHINMVIDPSGDVEEIKGLVRSHVSEAEAQRQHGKELIFTVPINSVNAFPELFQALEEKTDGDEPRSAKMGIRSYGVAMTTLEEVFLKLGEEAELQEEEEERNERNAENTRNGGFNGETVVTVDNNSGTVDFRNSMPSLKDFEPLTKKQLIRQQIRALIKIRLSLLRRNGPLFFFQIIFPIIYAIAGASMLRFIPMPQQPIPTSLQLQASSYANSTLNTRSPNMLINYTESSSEQESFVSNIRAQSLVLDPYSNVSDLPPRNYFLGLGVNDVTNASQVISSSMTVLYNDSAIHAIPATINTAMSSLWRMVGGQNNINASSKPWPWTTVRSLGFNGAVFSSSIFFSISVAAIPGGFALLMLADRDKHVRSQLRLAGLKLNVYLGTMFMFDAAQYFIACFLILIVLIAFQIPSMSTGGAVLSIILVYFGCVPSNILFAYNLSYVFTNLQTARSTVPNFLIWSAMLLVMIVSGVDMAGSGAASLACHYVFTILCPPYVVAGAFYFIDKVYRNSLVQYGTSRTIPVSEYFDPSSNILISMLMPIVHIVLLYFLLRVNEVRSTGARWQECLHCSGGNNSVSSLGTVPEENDDIPEEEDTDVIAERQRVEQSERSNMKQVIRVRNLRKEFSKNQRSAGCSCKKQTAATKTRVAVRNSTFMVQPGEVLGLLGPNGAGKTTTMNMIISETAPSRGKVTVANHDIRSNLSDAFREMGYCPQHDPLWEYVLLREHLECYAAIRGIPQPKIEQVINYFMESLNIKEHAEKKAKSLSGGTKRKLSYIISMLGDPKVVLLDEPSTGMDPKSKRFLWDTISAAFDNDERGALLTTHYMDEADALCSRVSIMVNGQMQCIGSTQHLKNKYGGGYLLEVKMPRAPTENQAEEAMRALKDFIDHAFPGATCQEAFGDRVQYRIPQASVTSLSETFRKLEECKNRLSVEEYSFSQATLEQVFLEFAKNQVEDGDQVEDVAQMTTSRSLHRQMSQHGAGNV